MYDPRCAWTSPQALLEWAMRLDLPLSPAGAEAMVAAFPEGEKLVNTGLAPLGNTVMGIKFWIMEELASHPEYKGSVRERPVAKKPQVDVFLPDYGQLPRNDVVRPSLQWQYDQLDFAAKLIEDVQEHLDANEVFCWE